MPDSKPFYRGWLFWFLVVWAVVFFTFADYRPTIQQRGSTSGRPKSEAQLGCAHIETAIETYGNSPRSPGSSDESRWPENAARACSSAWRAVASSQRRRGHRLTRWGQPFSVRNEEATRRKRVFPRLDYRARRNHRSVSSGSAPNVPFQTPEPW